VTQLELDWKWISSLALPVGRAGPRRRTRSLARKLVKINWTEAGEVNEERGLD
jgi:hypothetical protein